MNHDHFDDGSRRTSLRRPFRREVAARRSGTNAPASPRKVSEDGPRATGGDRERLAFVGWDEV